MNEVYNKIQRKLRKHTGDAKKKYALLYDVYAKYQSEKEAIEESENEVRQYKKILEEYTENVGCPTWMLPDSIISISGLHDDWCNRNED